MSRRPNEATIETGPATSAEMLEALVETAQALASANKIQAGAIEAQACAIEAIKARLELEALQTREREAEQAALLCEARRELAEKAAALEIEKTRREAAERSLAEHEAFAAAVRAALPLASALAETPQASENEPADELQVCAPAGVASALAEAHVASDGHRFSDVEGFGATTATDQADDTISGSLQVAIDLDGDERKTLARVAERRGMNPDDWIAALVRRELRALAQADADARDPDAVREVAADG